MLKDPETGALVIVEPTAVSVQSVDDASMYAVMARDAEGDSLGFALDPTNAMGLVLALLDEMARSGVRAGQAVPMFAKGLVADRQMIACQEFTAGYTADRSCLVLAFRFGKEVFSVALPAGELDELIGRIVEATAAMRAPRGATR